MYYDPRLDGAKAYQKQRFNGNLQLHFVKINRGAAVGG